MLGEKEGTGNDHMRCLKASPKSARISIPSALLALRYAFFVCLETRHRGEHPYGLHKVANTMLYKGIISGFGPTGTILAFVAYE
jgi:hypothetical protein